MEEAWKTSKTADNYRKNVTYLVVVLATSQVDFSKEVRKMNGTPDDLMEMERIFPERNSNKFNDTVPWRTEGSGHWPEIASDKMGAARI